MCVDRVETCERVGKERGQIYISSHNHPDVIMGQVGRSGAGWSRGKGAEKGQGAGVGAGEGVGQGRGR